MPYGNMWRLEFRLKITFILFFPMSYLTDKSGLFCYIILEMFTGKKNHHTGDLNVKLRKRQPKSDTIALTTWAPPAAIS